MPITQEFTEARAVGPLRALVARDLQFDDDYAQRHAGQFDDEEWLEALRGWQADAERMLQHVSVYPAAYWHEGERHNFLVWFSLVDGEAFGVRVSAFSPEIQPREARPDTMITEAMIYWSHPAPAHDC